MIKPGLVSITFRQHSPQEVVALAAQAGLCGIEWGGDIHVPPGDLDAAQRAAALTLRAGLAVAAYGSYYRAGEDDPASFSQVLDSARALGAPMIRVWAGRTASLAAPRALRDNVAADLKRIAEHAAPAGVRIVCEWHENTLTDTSESAAALFGEARHLNLQTYWQPHKNMSTEECLRDMDAALPRLAGLHVFHWEGTARLPLADGAGAWKSYLNKAAPAGDMYALLEFVRADEPRQMLRDAATLCEWLAEMHA